MACKEDAFELIETKQSSLNWERIVRGAVTLMRIRSFWGQLGQYLKAVRRRGALVVND